MDCDAAASPMATMPTSSVLAGEHCDAAACAVTMPFLPLTAASLSATGAAVGCAAADEVASAVMHLSTLLSATGPAEGRTSTSLSANGTALGEGGGVWQLGCRAAAESFDAASAGSPAGLREVTMSGEPSEVSAPSLPEADASP